MDSVRLELMEKQLRLVQALQRRRSERWCLTLWGRYIKARDGHRCLICGAGERLHAHHIFRRALYPHGWYQPGNGITLCHECHESPHAVFNGRPDFNQPVDAQGGDDLDNVACYFQCLLVDARARRLGHDDFYFIEDHMLQFIVSLQGYEHLYDAVQQGKMSRLQMAYEAMRGMPEVVYRRFFEAIAL
ncbi:hypothetical protein D3C78_1309450 [compost metagenome]